MAPARRDASVAGGGRSRRRLVDPEGAAELAADALGLCPRGVGPEHDAVPVVWILGLEYARREPRAGELLRHLRRPGLVWRRRHRPAHGSLRPRRIGRRALIGLSARISERATIRAAGPPLCEHPQVRAASLYASRCRERVGSVGYHIVSLAHQQG